FVLGGWIADKIYSPAHHGEYHGVAWIETDSGEEDDEAPILMKPVSPPGPIMSPSPAPHSKTSSRR
ncbi:hypothetical protein N9P40_00520, partial [Planktomarina temperata]|nr:hypothetical protein [Planktomarina temperata]